MLVLSRKVDQEIIIPELGITLKVLEASGSRVKLGITAPSSIAVHRAEAYAGQPPRKPADPLSLPHCQTVDSTA